MRPASFSAAAHTADQVRHQRLAAGRAAQHVALALELGELQAVVSKDAIGERDSARALLAAGRLAVTPSDASGAAAASVQCVPPPSTPHRLHIEAWA